MISIVYSENRDVACYNDCLFKKDKKTGYYLSTCKIGGKRKRLHVYVYESEYGEIPKGYEVHHIDFNKENNNAENLKLLSKKEHMILHGKELNEEKRDKRRQNVVKNAMPKAKEWHKSETGRKWHSEHAKEIYKKIPLHKYRCTFCGADFETKNIYAENSNTFCSNKCKSAFRRRSGIDDIEKECQYCGKKYIANKYANTKFCKQHRHRKNRVWRP